MQQSSRNHTHLFRMFHLHQTVASIPDPERCTDHTYYCITSANGTDQFVIITVCNAGTCNQEAPVLLLFPGHLRMWLFLPLFASAVVFAAVVSSAVVSAAVVSAAVVSCLDAVFPAHPVTAIIAPAKIAASHLLLFLILYLLSVCLSYVPLFCCFHLFVQPFAQG